MTEQETAYVKECIANNPHKFYLWSKWKKVRQEVLEQDRFECQDCKAKGIYTRATTVHHNQFLLKHPQLALEKTYTFKGKEYRNLVSLCHDCHEKRHGYRKKEQKQPLTEERWD